MKAKTKTILAVALVVGVGVTWVPQLLSAGGETKPAAGPVLGADGKPIGGEASTASSESSPPAQEGSAPRAVHGASDAPATAADGAARTSDAVESASGSLAGSLDARLDLVKAFLPERSAKDLDVLAAAWSLEAAQREAADAPAQVEAPPTTSTGEREPAPIAEPPPTAAEILALFAAEHPLASLVRGRSKRLATLGHELVREGQELEHGIVVEQIGPRFVVLALESERLRVDLAPFAARAKVVEGSSSGSGTSGVPGSPAGGASTATSPTVAPLAPAPVDVDALTKAAAELVSKLGTDASKSASAGSEAGDKDKEKKK